MIFRKTPFTIGIIRKLYYMIALRHNAIQQISLLENLGVDLERCFHNTNISHEKLREKGVCVKESQLRQFYRNSVTEYGNPFLGIMMGDNVSINYTGYLGLAFMSARTLKDSIGISINHPQLTGSTFEQGLKILETEFTLTQT